MGVKEYYHTSWCFRKGATKTISIDLIIEMSCWFLSFLLHINNKHNHVSMSFYWTSSLYQNKSLLQRWVRVSWLESVHIFTFVIFWCSSIFSLVNSFLFYHLSDIISITLQNLLFGHHLHAKIKCWNNVRDYHGPWLWKVPYLIQ